MRLSFVHNDDFFIQRTLQRAGNGAVLPNGYRTEVEDFCRAAEGHKAPWILPEYEPVRSRAIGYSQQVREAWERSYAQTSLHIRRINGMDFSAGELKVYALHPAVYDRGLNKGLIFIGGSGNGSMTEILSGMWHLVLHIPLRPQRVSAEHAAIDLVTEDMDTRLDEMINGARYGTHPPYPEERPFVGHPFLAGLKSGMMGQWRNHLEEGGDIWEFINKARETQPHYM